ncbi:hypothetical protein [Henriciella litoralis]|uniref:hypothetical protein n=1 Tax=Henriciella litoralis TaxID=568102 RepID=UPI00111C7F77|nr:hypothetical protein [Henriciella litoralis]
MTSDAPVVYDSVAYHRAAKNRVERTVLNYAGVKPRRTFQFGPVKTATPRKIDGWLKQAGKRGTGMAKRLARA